MNRMMMTDVVDLVVWSAGIGCFVTLLAMGYWAAVIGLVVSLVLVFASVARIARLVNPGQEMRS